MSNNSSEAEDYYLVKIETNEKSFNKKDETFKLYSGIPVMIGIITGKEVSWSILYLHLNLNFPLRCQRDNYLDDLVILSYL